MSAVCPTAAKIRLTSAQLVSCANLALHLYVVTSAVPSRQKAAWSGRLFLMGYDNLDNLGFVADFRGALANRATPAEILEEQWQ